MCLGSEALQGGGAKLNQVTIERHPSPNFGPRRGVKGPSLIVLHYTAMPSLAAALERLTDPQHEVSAHYIIDQRGRVIQLVAEAQRAWHAGNGFWGPYCDINSASIGVELCNTGGHRFPELQMEALKALLGEVKQRWAISADKVIGHSDMAPNRKKDPGRWFDWQYLAVDDLAVFRGHPHALRLPFLEAARMFGYLMPDFTCENGAYHAIVLEAFRQRFRPEVSGPLDNLDIQILSDLAQSFPAVVEP